MSRDPTSVTRAIATAIERLNRLAVDRAALLEEFARLAAAIEQEQGSGDPAASALRQLRLLDEEVVRLDREATSLLDHCVRLMAEGRGT